MSQCVLLVTDQVFLMAKLLVTEEESCRMVSTCCSGFLKAT